MKDYLTIGDLVFHRLSFLFPSLPAPHLCVKMHIKLSSIGQKKRGKENSKRIKVNFSHKSILKLKTIVRSTVFTLILDLLSSILVTELIEMFNLYCRKKSVM